MDLKHKDPVYNHFVAELRATQTLIDRRISQLQNNPIEIDYHSGRLSRDKPIQNNTNLLILTLDELLDKELAKSYYLDYLSNLNLQKYVLFYSFAQEWKQIALERLVKSKSGKEDINKQIRNEARKMYDKVS